MDCGFSQKEGVGYDEIFAPFAQYTAIRSIISLASNQGWSLHKMDVKAEFLHGLHCEVVRKMRYAGIQVCVYSNGTKFQEVMWKSF